MKIMKKKKMHVELIKLNFIESIYLKKIVARVTFFRSMYIIVYLTINVSINNIKIKILFDNNVKINYILKRLIDAAQLFIRQEINIIMMNFINERACFLNVCKSIFINIENINISISIFVIERLDYDFF